MSEQTCLQCAISKVRCDKKRPCDRCVRRNTTCTAQPRKRGRPTKDDTTSRYTSPAAVDVENVSKANDGEMPGGASVKSSSLDGSPRGNDMADGRFRATVYQQQRQHNYQVMSFMETILDFLDANPNLTLGNHRNHPNHPSVVLPRLMLQNAIQGAVLRNNFQVVHDAVQVADKLGIDSRAAVEWCERLSEPGQPEAAADDPSPAPGGRITAESHVLSVDYMQLPEYISAVANSRDTPAFVYAYYCGQESFATNSTWSVLTQTTSLPPNLRPSLAHHPLPCGRLAHVHTLSLTHNLSLARPTLECTTHLAGRAR